MSDKDTYIAFKTDCKNVMSGRAMKLFIEKLLTAVPDDRIVEFEISCKVRKHKKQPKNARLGDKK